MNLKELHRGITDLGKQSWLLFIALSFTNASNYIFHVVISRMLGPADYGALTAVLAILVVLSVPLGAVQTTVAKRFARESRELSDNDPALGSYLRIGAKAGAVVSLLVAAAAPFLHALLRLDSYLPLFVISIYVFPSVLNAVLRGALQGTLQFKRLALVSSVPVFVRLAVGIAVVAAGGGVGGAVAASVVAEFLGLALGFWLVGASRFKTHGTMKSTGLFKEIAPTAAGLAAIWLLIDLDLVLARHFLSANEAGEYAAAGTLARAALFIPGAISMIALPHFAKHRGRGAEAYRWLIAASALVVTLGGLACAFLTVTREAAITLTFGERFAAAADLLPMLSLAMVGLGVVNLLLFFHVAAGSRAFYLLWPAAVLEAILISMFHSSGEQIAMVVAGVSFLMAAGGFWTARGLAKAAPPLARLPKDVFVAHPDLRVVKSTSDPSQPELTLVVPSYNGGSQLTETICDMTTSLRELGRSFEVIVVSDGSTDGSERELMAASQEVRVLHYPHRQGKGTALRVGMARAKGRYVAFIDGDGDLDVREISNFLSLMDLYDPHLILGSKRHPLSQLQYPLLRRILSWIYQKVVRVLFGLNVRDTQTGMKLIRRDVLDAVLPRMLEKRFAFDLEFLVVARRLGFRRLFEAPVRLDYKFESTVAPRAAVHILLDTAAIFYRRFILRYYDETPDAFDRSKYVTSLRDRPLVLPVEAATVEQGANG